MRSPRLTCVLGLVLMLTLSLSMTSCGGGGGSGGGNPDLVLLGFNYPNIAGVVLNAPLVFTFSNNIAPNSITPDTLRVVGATAPTFETTVVDGNLVALLPTTPNFADYSDAGFAVGTTYTVSLAVFPAPSTIETPTGKPLLEAESFTFVTLPAPAFMENRRPIIHGVAPTQGGTSDDEGCLQNSNNALFQPPGVKQTNLGKTLLCLQNEGPPRVIEPQSVPRFGAINVGTPNAVTAGLIDLPALRLRFNEALDPLTVIPYIPTEQFGVNVQLFRVADKSGNPIAPPTQVKTNQPIIVQSLDSIEIILVAAGAVQQGIYCVIARPALVDMAQNPLRINDDELPGIRYSPYDGDPDLPTGWRLYFETLEVPNTSSFITEEFSQNITEHGDLVSGVSEPGIYTVSDPPGGDLDDPIAALDTSAPATAAQPVYTLLDSNLGCGQTTTANWNNSSGNGYRFLNLPGVSANPDSGGGPGELRAVFKPYTGTAQDGIFDSNLPPYSAGAGDEISLSTTLGAGASANGDGVYEYQSFYLRSGDTVTIAGDNPALILCRGSFTVDGFLDLSGAAGGSGLNTDGSTTYTNAGAASVGGFGGEGGPGGGDGGIGSDPVLVIPGGGVGAAGTSARSLFGAITVNAGQGGLSGNGINQGGGGGGMVSTGDGGTAADTGLAAANGGSVVNTPTFVRNLTAFTPDRGYFPFSNISGGAGGGGGGADDDNEGGGLIGTVDNGDDGGGGGGGAGGGLWVIAADLLVNSSGAINADGGEGGSTYSEAQQTIDFGDDGNPGGGDDFVTGRLTDAEIALLTPPLNTPQGEGGPGGGGAGGGIFLCGVDSCDIDGTLSAIGGSGGVSAILAPGAGLIGGAGSIGGISLMTFAGSGAVDISGASISPTAFTGTYTPTIRNTSVGQSAWIDLAAPNADFDPDPPNNIPSWDSNVQFLTTIGGLTNGVDFKITLEFQGAVELSPVLPGTPTDALGLTVWSTDVNIMDMKRFVRWRFRFWVKDDYNAFGFGSLPLPTVLDLLIPYEAV